MRFYCITSLVILLSALIFVVGCGDSVEDSEANILEPRADFRFQNFPVLEKGSLIPPEEVPVITIEKTRQEDDDLVYWQLKADPVPTREDLVVGVGVGMEGNVDYLLYVPILKFEKTSMEIFTCLWHLIESTELSIVSTAAMIAGMHKNWSWIPPPRQIENGYVIPQGFLFTYYSRGEPSSLELPPKK